MSETSRCRSRLAKYCVGVGLDIGFGGDPIVPSAITMDLAEPYTKVGVHPQNLTGTCHRLPWFRDGVLDYIFSSHLIEDFRYKEQAGILFEWFRVLRPGGRLVLYQPDQQRFEAHCKKTGQPLNLAHKEPDYSLDAFAFNVLRIAPVHPMHSDFYILRGIHEMPAAKILHQNRQVEDYSWEIVLEKV